MYGTDGNVFIAVVYKKLMKMIESDFIEIKNVCLQLKQFFVDYLTYLTLNRTLD